MLKDTYQAKRTNAELKAVKLAKLTETERVNKMNEKYAELEDKIENL